MNRKLHKKNWFVLYTKSHCERMVSDRLASLNIEAYCPTKRTKRRWSDRWKWKEEPLFRSYCFVRLTEEERELVFQVPGVVRYLFWLEKPAIVKDEEIEQIKIWLNDFDHDQVETFYYNPGQKVEVTSGPLLFQKGQVLKQQGNYIYMKLEVLGITIRVNLCENKVEQRGYIPYS